MLRAIAHRIEEGLIALILGAMTLLTFLQVILRYVFGSGLLWALETTTYLFGWLVLIGISYGIRKRAHIGIDALVQAMPAKAKRIVGLIVVAAALLYAFLMFYGGWVYLDKLHALDVDAEDIPIQRWILNLCLPIGFALLGVRLAEMAWRIVTGQSPGFELADEAADAIKDVGGDPAHPRTTLPE
jgi:C4-dicarboxylate transporter, DctQ subunit